MSHPISGSGFLIGGPIPNDAGCQCGGIPGGPCFSFTTGTPIPYYHSARHIRAQNQKEETVPTPQERADDWTMKWTIISELTAEDGELSTLTHTIENASARLALEEFVKQYNDTSLRPIAVGKEGGGVLYFVREQSQWELTDNKAILGF